VGGRGRSARTAVQLDVLLSEYMATMGSMLKRNAALSQPQQANVLDPGKPAAEGHP